jgi:putative ABC transport system ATP-binding protein
MNIIEMNKLVFRWPTSEEVAISIDHLSIEQGKKVFLYGPSGSGKSTLLSLLTGINVADQGDVKILSSSLGGMNATERDKFRAQHIGYIFQQFNLIPYLNVLENVTLPCRLSKHRGKGGVDEYVSQALALLTKLGLDEKLAKRNVTDLSIGQQQRVAAARALMGSPELIIADEPCSALDDINASSFLELLTKQVEETRSTLVFVSHDLRLAKQFDYCLSLSDINKTGENQL